MQNYIKTTRGLIFSLLVHQDKKLLKKCQNLNIFFIASISKTIFFLLQFLPSLPPLWSNIFTYSESLGKLGSNHYFSFPVKLLITRFFLTLSYFWYTLLPSTGEYLAHTVSDCKVIAPQANVTLKRNIFILITNNQFGHTKEKYMYVLHIYETLSTILLF